jgi:hypothetical protein
MCEALDRSWGLMREGIRLTTYSNPPDEPSRNRSEWGPNPLRPDTCGGVREPSTGQARLPAWGHYTTPSFEEGPSGRHR